MSVTFGKRVVGEKAHADAVKKNKGGAEVFGRRVIGMLGANNPDNTAKANSEHGPRVTSKAHISDAEGKETAIAVDDLENVLKENPTFFDSLYEQELALPSGARTAALEIFAVVEMGKNGAGRRHVLDEINSLLGKDVTKAELRGTRVEAQQDKYAAMAERNEENKKLRDAPRLAALVKREEDLKTLGKAESRGTLNQVKNPVASLDPDRGDGDVKPETQQKTKRSSAKKK